MGVGRHCPFTCKPCTTTCQLWMGDGCAYELSALYLFNIGHQLNKMNRNANTPMATDAMGLE